jgi:hypothetical protein
MFLSDDHCFVSEQAIFAGNANTVRIVERELHLMLRDLRRPPNRFVNELLLNSQVIENQSVNGQLVFVATKDWGLNAFLWSVAGTNPEFHDPQ